mgnify:FL=1
MGSGEWAKREQMLVFRPRVCHGGLRCRSIEPARERSASGRSESSSSLRSDALPGAQPRCRAHACDVGARQISFLIPEERALGGRDARRTFIVRAGRRSRWAAWRATCRRLRGMGFRVFESVRRTLSASLCELVIIRRGAFADLSSAGRDDRGRSDSARSRTAHTRRALHRPWHEREALGYLQFRQLEPCAAVHP